MAELFMISVAAERANMHPQTLRMYEARGLITPKRSPKNTRLYSQDDVDRLRRIQELTTDYGLNLAGVEAVLELEDQVADLRRNLAAARRRANRMQAMLRQAVGTTELVPYRKYEVEISYRFPRH